MRSHHLHIHSLLLAQLRATPDLVAALNNISTNTAQARQHHMDDNVVSKANAANGDSLATVNSSTKAASRVRRNALPKDDSSKISDSTRKDALAAAVPRKRGKAFKSETFFETVEVHVGTAKPLTIHQSVLQKVDFFNKCLSTTMEEGRSKVAKMPEDDPAAFDILLQYVYFGADHLQPFIRGAFTYKEHRKQADKKLAFEVYVLAEKLGYEELQNFLMDALVEFWKDKLLRLPKAAIDYCDWPSHCALAKLRTSLIGYNIRKFGLDRYIQDSRSNADEVHRWIADGGPVVHDVFCIVADKATSAHPCSGDACKWHVHQRSAKCKESAETESGSMAREPGTTDEEWDFYQELMRSYGASLPDSR